MKNIGVRVLLPLMGGLILFGAGFATGGAYAARRASYAGSAASLVWLTGVDQALQSNDVAEARAVTAHAVDAHVAVLRQLDAAASSAILYVLPGLRISTALCRGIAFSALVNILPFIQRNRFGRKRGRI